MGNEVIIPVVAETKSFDEQIKAVEDKLNRMIEAYKKAANAKGEFKPNQEALAKYRVEIEKVNNELVSLKQQQEKISKQDLGNIQNDLSGIGDKIGGITKKVGKWALAIFSVRSAYMFVRNAVSRISEQDEELKANIEYLRDVLAYSIEPIIKTIVDWAKQILEYIGYIIKQVTGYNIFENANKKIKQTNKSAKELKKTLMGFDEVNILNGNSTLTGTGANVDLINLDNVKGLTDIIKEGKEIKKQMDIVYDAMDSNIQKSDQLADAIQKNFDSFDTKQAVNSLLYLDDQIDQSRFQIENLSKQKDNLWWSPSQQKKIEKQIDDYKTHITNLTTKKWLIKLETDVDTSELSDFLQSLLKNKSWLLKPSSWNDILKTFNALTNNEFRVSTSSGGHSFAKGGIIYPRLASGGIVNYPGRGIMYGGANIAEKGAEAILPLTDSQQMQLLGKAIADNLNLNATIPVYVGNRQVAREIRKIDIEDSFATNGG